MKNIHTRVVRLEAMQSVGNEDVNVFCYGEDDGDTPTGFSCNGIAVYCLPEETTDSARSRLCEMVKQPGRKVHFIESLYEVVL